MFTFFATIFSAIWIQEHWKEVVVGLIVLVALISIIRIRKKRQREAYLALPVLYIGNRSTRVFHTLSCPKIENLAPENSVPFRSRLEIQRMGYKPCSHCKP